MDKLELIDDDETSESSQTQSVSEWLSKVGCDIDQYLENINVLENKGSSSDSIIMFGDIMLNPIESFKKTPVTLKIVFDPKNSFNNSLKVEQQIYTNVIDNMINNSHTPHLVKWLGFVKTCDTNDIMKLLSETERKKFKIARDKIKKDVYNLDNMSMIILEKSNGITLHRFLKQYKTLGIDDEILFDIIFQLLYTLRCFEKLGLTHNDLHFDNIFIEKLGYPEERIYYISDSKWVKINAEYDIKLYDFDRASIYHPSVDRNFTLDFRHCKPFAQCNKFNSRTDLSAVLSSLARRDCPPINTFIRGCMSEKFYESLAKREFSQINNYGELTDNELNSIAVCIDKLINHRYFSRNKIGDGKTEGVIYTLPPSLQPGIWLPTSNKSHASMKREPSNESVSLFLVDEYVNTIGIYYIVKDNIYEKEFGKSYIDDARKKLFKEFIKRKNVMKRLHILYMTACYILSIPFVYKLDDRQLEIFVYNGKILEYTIVDSMDVIKCINDVWNIFNGTLPVAMIKI